MNSTYQYIEDNGGGLYLFIFDTDNQVIGGIENLEHAEAGEWASVKDEIDANPAEAVRTWEGHMDDPAAIYAEFLANEYGSEVVAADGELYPNRMGRAAERYFIAKPPTRNRADVSTHTARSRRALALLRQLAQEAGYLEKGPYLAGLDKMLDEIEAGIVALKLQ